MATTTKHRGRGRIFTRGKSRRYYVQYYVNGVQIVRALKDEGGAPITVEREAIKAADRLLAPLNASDQVQLRRQAVAALRDAEELHAEALELARTRLPLRDAWGQYIAAQNRPDSGESTLRQYRFQWEAFAAWAANAYPDAPALCQVTPAMAAAYAVHVQGKGMSAGTVNKHVRLLRLVFRVLGPGEGLSANPFDVINSKHEVQTHRQELSWDILGKVCDAAQGEMKRLLFLGIYTGQRLADCCLLSWDQVDLLRQPGWILLTPRKTARRGARTLHVPIHPALRAMLESTPDEARTGFVLPELAAHYQANRDRITDRVQDLFFRCGVQIHKPGTGRQRDPHSGKEVHTGKRAVLQYGFHSLRHTTVTLLQEAGVPQAVVQEIVGHRTVAMTQRYTHIGREALQKAVAALPSTVPTGQPALPAAPDSERGDRARLHRLADTLPIAEVRDLLSRAPTDH